MHTFHAHLASLSIVAALAVACGGGSDPIVGSWNQPDGSIPLPASLGGGDVASDNTLAFDDSTFTLTMALSFDGLTDTLVAQGTYVDDGSALALTFTGFVLAASSGDTQNVGDDGSQCVTLTALAGANVCFQTPQSATYQIADDTLTIAIDNALVGGPMQPTTLTLKRTQ